MIKETRQEEEQEEEDSERKNEGKKPSGWAEEAAAAVLARTQSPIYDISPHEWTAAAVSVVIHGGQCGVRKSTYCELRLHPARPWPISGAYP